MVAPFPWLPRAGPSRAPRTARFVRTLPWLPRAGPSRAPRTARFVRTLPWLPRAGPSRAPRTAGFVRTLPALSRLPCSARTPARTPSTHPAAYGETVSPAKRDPAARVARVPMPEQVLPMLATPGLLPTDDEHWSFEMKWDGV